MFKKTVKKIWRIMKFIFYSTIKLCVNLANVGSYTRMTPLEIIVGIIVTLLILVPTAAIIVALWELFAESFN
jgi:hypothetical protein